ncbi:hypothetical protein [Facklamia miroungae]|uniref:DUF3784 domain-containing protein n=1 Tax=Facklamia miroungae TaxID=120956 RepID=A0A1G7SQN7_9LACT|nr:hypothetical protein [Facklamia miroungae]NKZ29571.1 hypothetical protein [Facklamia miroungae]SDG25416.1 hypothetical protein SAMN05421791_104121 [Facklamia miroungae]
MVFLLIIIGLLLIIIGIQLRRGKWYGIVAGNNFKDKPIEIQKKGALGASSITLLVGSFLIIIYILDFYGIQTRFLTLPVFVIVIPYSFFSIYKYLKHFIKYGE